MIEHEASRTLVKSPPELWAELSDQSSLARHLAEPFGEIRITRLEPETAVAWEGERASGTVRLEPSEWGTRVILTARAVRVAPPEPEASGSLEARPEPPAPEPAQLPRPDPPPASLPPAAEELMPSVLAPANGRRVFGRLRRWLRSKRPAARDEEPESTVEANRPPAGASAPAAAPAEAEATVVAAAAVTVAAAAPAPDEAVVAAAPAPDEAVVAAAARAAAPAPAFDPDAGLVGVLDRLGAAHHRPFSRA